MTADDVRARLERLESLVEQQRETIAAQHDPIADLERATALRDGAGPGTDEQPAVMNRRSALKAGGLVALFGFGVGTASADPQGQVGTAADPLRELHTQTAYAAELNGAVTTEPVTSLSGTGLSVRNGALTASTTGVADHGASVTSEATEIDFGAGFVVADDGGERVTVLSKSRAATLSGPNLDATTNEVSLEITTLRVDSAELVVENRDTGASVTRSVSSTGPLTVSIGLVNGETVDATLYRRSNHDIQLATGSETASDASIDGVRARAGSTEVTFDLDSFSGAGASVFVLAENVDAGSTSSVTFSSTGADKRIALSSIDVGDEVTVTVYERSSQAVVLASGSDIASEATISAVQGRAGTNEVAFDLDSFGGTGGSVSVAVADLDAGSSNSATVASTGTNPVALSPLDVDNEVTVTVYTSSDQVEELASRTDQVAGATLSNLGVTYGGSNANTVSFSLDSFTETPSVYVVAENLDGTTTSTTTFSSTGNYDINLTVSGGDEVRVTVYESTSARNELDRLQGTG